MAAGRSLLVLGGARSGKSAYAEARARDHGGPLVYVATAAAGDAEMSERIRRHQERRGAGWRTVEVPLDLVGALQAYTSAGSFVLVDCITLWVSNLMLADRDVAADVEALALALPALPGTVALVSNEVGLGIVPDNPLARRFRDAAGLANQRLAAACEEVVFIAAGLPLRLK